jgi:hypothetical protein
LAVKPGILPLDNNRLLFECLGIVRYKLVGPHHEKDSDFDALINVTLYQHVTSALISELINHLLIGDQIQVFTEHYFSVIL